MAEKNFYQALGVSESASEEDIKKAYRKLARKYHPDVTGGDKAKEEKFKEISQAYDTLSDQKKKSDYDAMRKNPFSQPGASSGAGFEGFSGFGGFSKGTRTTNRSHADLNDLFGGNDSFSDLFGNSSGFSRSSNRGVDLQTQIDLTLTEAALGIEKSLVLEPQVSGGRKVTVRIPAGVENDEIIRVPGKGRPGSRGGTAGDLLLTIRVLPHPSLRRRGADLEMDLPIQIDEAVLGTKREVTTLEGKIQVKVPPGTSSGQKLRLKGQGASDRKGGRGDLYTIIQIQVPKNISEEAKTLIEQFAQLTK